MPATYMPVRGARVVSGTPPAPFRLMFTKWCHVASPTMRPTAAGSPSYAEIAPKQRGRTGGFLVSVMKRPAEIETATTCAAMRGPPPVGVGHSSTPAKLPATVGGATHSLSCA